MAITNRYKYNANVSPVVIGMQHAAAAAGSQEKGGFKSPQRRCWEKRSRCTKYKEGKLYSPQQPSA